MPAVTYCFKIRSRDDIPMEQNVDEALVEVGDEEGLKKMIESDFSDSEQSEDDDDNSKSFRVAEEKEICCMGISFSVSCLWLF